MNAGTVIFSKTGGRVSALSGSFCTYTNDELAKESTATGLHLNKILEMLNDCSLVNIRLYQVREKAGQQAKKHGISYEKAVILLRQTVEKHYKDGTLKDILEGI